MLKLDATLPIGDVQPTERKDRDTLKSLVKLQGCRRCDETMDGWHEHPGDLPVRLDSMKLRTGLVIPKVV